MEKKILEILKEYYLELTDLTEEEVEKIRRQIEAEEHGAIILNGYDQWLRQKSLEITIRKTT
ncbi:MAG: hypothetical protein K6C10_08725 [Prevotella sp.]|nr:hypothetical protein [Prevotella sp.]